jgi:hypothetical protein
VAGRRHLADVLAVDAFDAGVGEVRRRDDDARHQRRQRRTGEAVVGVQHAGGDEPDPVEPHLGEEQQEEEPAEVPLRAADRRVPDPGG